MKWRQLKWTKAISSWKKAICHLNSYRNSLVRSYIWVFRGASWNTDHYWASLLSLTHSILFCFNSFQEAEKFTFPKWSAPAVSHSSYQANSKSVHIMPGNPTSSTGAKESGTIFNIFTPLTLGILPKDGVLLLRQLLLQCPHFSSAQWYCSQLANWSAYTATNTLLPIIICHLIVSVLTFLIWPVISCCSH